jgi:hypothetical protein
VTLADALQPLDEFNVDAISSGSVSGPIHEVFRSERLPQLLSLARERYEYVVIDTPPIVPVVDPALLARVVDGLLVVVSANKTPRKLLEEALNELDSASGRSFSTTTIARSMECDGNYRRCFPASQLTNQENGDGLETDVLLRSVSACRAPGVGVLQQF